jgi:hypothetical protein
MIKKKYIVVPELLSINSSVSYLPRFSFGEHLGEESWQQTKLELNFEVSNSIDRGFATGNKHHYYFIKENQVYFERNLGFGRTVQMIIQDLYNYPSVVVNPFYYKFVRFQLGVVLPPGRHLLDLATILFFKNGYFPLHCSSISKNGKAIAILAPPDTGKTYTALNLTKAEFSILSEDMAISDGKRIWGCPFTGTFYHLIGERNISAWKKNITYFYSRLVNVFPLIARIIKPPIKNMLSIVSDSFVSSSDIVGLIFLQRSKKNEISSLKPNDVYYQLKLSNRIEFNYDINPALLAFSGTNINYDLSEFRDIELQYLKQISNSIPAIKIKADDHLKFPKLVNEIYNELV